MRWPFGPPHLTLKPSQKKKKKKQNKNKKKTSKKVTNQNKGKKGEKGEKRQGKPKNTKNRAFSYQSKFSVFILGVPKFPFLRTWPKNRAPKNTIKIGFQQAIFWKTVMRHETAILGQNKQIQKFQLSFFLLLSSLETTKNTILLKTYFYSALAIKKRDKTQKIK